MRGSAPVASTARRDPLCSCGGYSGAGADRGPSCESRSKGLGVLLLALRALLSSLAPLWLKQDRAPCETVLFGFHLNFSPPPAVTGYVARSREDGGRGAGETALDEYHHQTAATVAGTTDRASAVEVAPEPRRWRDCEFRRCREERQQPQWGRKRRRQNRVSRASSRAERAQVRRRGLAEKTASPEVIGPSRCATAHAAAAASPGASCSGARAPTRSTHAVDSRSVSSSIESTGM